MTSQLPPSLAHLFEGVGQPPVSQMNLLAALWGNGDVPIPSLYGAVLSTPTPNQEQRHLQQALGPYIIRLNRRLKKARLAVKPGRLKGTYCVSSI
jgi:hypothetical protein